MAQRYDIEKAQKAYGEFLSALGFNWQEDPNMKDTPKRVAKAWVHDLCKGLFDGDPSITAFENVDEYDGMVFQGDIKVVSMCSHHNLAFTGVAHVAYIPTKDSKIVGLSKLNRIVDFFARRPQVQENLTMQIHNFINHVCEGNLGVAVEVSCNHTCCSNRGIGHESTMKTSKLSGAFLDRTDNAKLEFYHFVEQLRKQ